MNITEEMVDYVSTLSRLKLPDGEKARMAKELARVLDYMDTLNLLDTGDVEPMSHVFPLENVLRTDTVEPSLDRADILSQAPASDASAFLVPKAVE